jgi:hypothetical protein
MEEDKTHLPITCRFIHGIQNARCVSEIIVCAFVLLRQSGTEYSNIHPTRCDVTQFILSGSRSTCFGCYHHPSSGAQTTGICHTVTATCRCRGRDGTGLSVAYATHSTLKPVPTLPRQRQVAVTV